MTLSRREFLRISTLISAGFGLAGCSPLYNRMANLLDPDPEVDLTRLETDAATATFAALSRLTFGPQPAEVQSASQHGLSAWIEEQLAPGMMNDLNCEIRLRPFDTLTMKATELVDWNDKIFDDYDRETVPSELRQATLIRQVYSRRQLYEVMVEFWSDHFNISCDKGDCWFLKTVDDRQAIRPHVFGKFSDLLWASSHSPAMLVYLDNQSNNRNAPNENYAREVMELHTLGFNGGYTQEDVMELARCLTGWTVKEHFWRGEFSFDAALHDPDTKYVLGKDIQPNGQKEAEQVLELLAEHPSTARNIATKLTRRFIADDPPEEIVDKASQAFLKNQGDIRMVLRPILLDGLQYAKPKFKRPLRFVVSALRTILAETDGGPGIQKALGNMGHLHFKWPTPDGYPDNNTSWAGNLMPRWRFAQALVMNDIPGTRINHINLLKSAGTSTPEEIIDCLSMRLLGRGLPNEQRRVILKNTSNHHLNHTEISNVVTASLIASPEFQWQ